MGDPFQLNIEEFLRLKSRLSEVDAEAKSIRDDMAKLEPLIAEQFLSRGIQNMSINGSTVYKVVDTFISVDKERQHEAVEVAEALGLEDMIVLQPQRFSAWAREMLANEGAIPSEFTELAKVHETTRIKVRKA